jgi:hypothetical protein
MKLGSFLAVFIVVSLSMISSCRALQEVAGTLVLTTPAGGSGVAKFGLMNDENATITVKLSAGGDAAKYLSFPATVDLPPKKIVYTNITANVPADFDASSGRNVTATLFAVQEGTQGQVQLNIRLSKKVVVTVAGQVIIRESQDVGRSSITGLANLVSTNSLLIGALVAMVVIALAFFKIGQRSSSYPR